MRALFKIGLLFGVMNLAVGVKREDFKTCSQSSFCRRNRELAKVGAANPTPSPYAVLPDSLHFQNSEFSADIVNQRNHVKFTLQVFFLENDAVRVRVNEKIPIKPRYDEAKKHVLVKEPALKRHADLVRKDTSGEAFSVEYSDGLYTATVQFSPFQIEFSSAEGPLLTLNERGLFNFEHLRVKEEPTPEQAEKKRIVEPTPDAPGEDENEDDAVEEEDLDASTSEDGLWEETFKGFTDPKKDGPSSIGVDVTFHGVSHVYGIPEHASQLSLKTTTGEAAEYTEPYRLYNLDVFEYEVDTPMALYGSIPFMVGHRSGGSVGVFWLNSAEMWIDVEKTSSASRSHWIAESGLLDLFVFLVRRSDRIHRPPPAFALGYHQCRWNYNNQADVAGVDAKFDKHDIPYDVIWLDIEHTDGKRYFTWDKNKFASPVQMQNNLTTRGRKLVTIVDPHIRRDDNYYVYKEAATQGFFIKDPSGGDFDGWCWPGSSAWVDYTIPEACRWWASLFKLDQYSGSTEALYVWNDMNEPSVFSGPEITMPKDRVHSGGWEHRHLHNMYGMLFHKSTANGLIQRLDVNRRPFVLSRAFFPGTQRVGAIWTGDNRASWDHLESAAPMLLSIGLVGIGFSGADVGGFFGNPEPELLVRWYQAGAFQPFFRGHAHIDSKRREPWMFGEPTTRQIRAAIRGRYRLLPYWYTLFFEGSISGVPPMRPMFLEFPDDEACFGMDAQYMVGSGLLVKPVTQSGVTQLQVYLPASAIWYDYYSLAPAKPGWQTVPSPADFIPVFLRGGSILPIRNRIRRSSTLMRDDPIALLVALDSKGQASGHLYLDDGDTYAYLQGDFAYRHLVFDGAHLTNSALSPTEFDNSLASVRVEEIVIVGLPKAPSKVVCTKCGREVGFKYVAELHQLVIKDPKLNAAQDWTLALE
ncbi:glucosidase II [Massospora cicadina]|nr:glucosidase II [Massospora cicadina]